MNRLFAFLLALLCCGAALAQSAYPNRPIRLVIPWPPGQATDLAGRLIAQELQKALGQPVVPDNRPGAGGMIGTDAVAKAAPDGYTLLAASSGPVTVAPLMQKVPYNVDQELAPVYRVGMSPYLLVAHPSFPANNAKEFVALLKANPGKYTFSSSGTGAAAHLIIEMFNAAAQVQAVHVPYKGSAQSLTDLMSGQIGYSIETLAATGPHVRAGKLKTFGVSFEKGSALAPEVPPLASAAGLPGFNAGAWLGVMAPAGTPKDVIARLAAETEKATQSAEFRERFNHILVELIPGSTETFAAYLKSESARYAAIIKQANIRPND